MPHLEAIIELLKRLIQIDEKSARKLHKCSEKKATKTLEITYF